MKYLMENIVLKSLATPALLWKKKYFKVENSRKQQKSRYAQV